MSNVRAKFRVTAKSDPYPDGAIGIEMQPVCSSNPQHENKRFWEATPAGKIEMSISNRPAADVFELGEEYYVDFTKAPPTKDE